MVFEQGVVISFAYKQTPYKSHSKLGYDKAMTKTEFETISQILFFVIKLL